MSRRITFEEKSIDIPTFFFLVDVQIIKNNFAIQYL